MINVVYGETTKNVRNAINVGFVIYKENYLQWTSMSHYRSKERFSNKMIYLKYVKVKLH